MNMYLESDVSLLDDLNYAKFENARQKLGKQFDLPFAIHSRTSEGRLVSGNRLFSSHPRNCSGSYTSVSTTPRPFQPNYEFEVENLERNKEKIKNARKKLHEKLTHTQPPEEELLDVHIGDSYDDSPRNSFSNTNNNRTTKFHRNDDAQGPSEVKGTVVKRKSSALIPVVKFKPEKQEEKIVASKCVTATPQAQPKIIPEHIFEKKFKSFVEKSLQALNGIRILLKKGIEPPDGDEDISRRKLRVKEFSNRFSRNYLYPIVRQIDDLTKFKQPHPTLNQKMLTAYHVIFNGLVAYQNHLPTSIGACSSDKLKALLKHLIDLCDIHEKLLPREDENGYLDFIETYKQNAEITIQKIEDQFTNYQVVSSLQLHPSQFRGEQKGTKPVKRQKQHLENRLYMYSAAPIQKKDTLWKKAAEALGKKKICIKSRYKTAQFKHRPPMERNKNDMLRVSTASSNCKIVSQKSNSDFKKSCLPSPVNEDNISTMVQMEDNDNTPNDKENCEMDDEIKRKMVNHEEIMVKLLQLVLEMKEKKKDNTEGNGQRSNDDKMSNILEKIRKDCDYELLKETLSELQENNNQVNEKLELKIVESTESHSPKSSRSRKEPTVTVSGTKNAQLICIKDDNSIEEYENPKDEESEKVLQLKPIQPENQTDSDKENKGDCQKPSTSLSMKRSSKSSKCLQMLPKDYALSIIQYKIDFHKHCKTNPMYRRTAKITPWVLMDKMSDKILNLALLGIAREVDVEVVDKIYQSELQFC